MQIGGLISPKHDATTGAQRYFFDLLDSLPGAGVGARGILIGELPPTMYQRDDLELIAPFGTTPWGRVAQQRVAMTRLLPTADLTVSHFAPHAFPVLDLIRRAQPLAVHFHGPWTLENVVSCSVPNLPMSAVQEVTVYARARRIITLFSGYARVLERIYRVAPERIRVVPGGVDITTFRIRQTRAQARLGLGLPLDRPIVLATARIVRSKGIDRILDAIDLVRRSLPDVLLVVAGSGAREGAMRRRVAAAGLERWVTFAGHVADALPAYYRAADLSISMTFGADGFGLVVPESLACGTPVLLVPLDGRRIESAEPALRYVGSRAVPEIAATLIDLLTGRAPAPDTRTCLAFARTRAWPVIAARIRDAYAEALG